MVTFIIDAHCFKIHMIWKVSPNCMQLKRLSLQWRHNGCDSISNHQLHDCLLNRLLRRISKKASKLPVSGLCAGNSPGNGEFPEQMASNAENVSIWWSHHVTATFYTKTAIYCVVFSQSVFQESSWGHRVNGHVIVIYWGIVVYW